MYGRRAKACWMILGARAGWYLARAQDDLPLHILCMPEGTFSLDTAKMLSSFLSHIEYIYNTKINVVFIIIMNPLRKHAYTNILKIFQPKKENFQVKIWDIFHIPSQNIDCGYSLEPPRRGGSNEYPQSMFFLAK